MTPDLFLVSEERTVEREDDRLFESKSDAGSEEGTADGDSRTVKKEVRFFELFSSERLCSSCLSQSSLWLAG